MDDNNQAKPRVFLDPEDDAWYFTDDDGSVIGPFVNEVTAQWQFDRDQDITAGRRPRATPEQEIIIQQFIQIDNAVLEMEEHLANLKASRKYIGEADMVEIIPVADRDRGLRLSDGTEWTFEEELHASVKEIDKQAAYTYLAENGDAGMIRQRYVISFKANAAQESAQFAEMVRRILPEYQISIRVGKTPNVLPTALKEILKAAKLDPVVTLETEPSLPGSTMKAWVKKRLAQGKEVPECFSYFAPLRPKMVPPPPLPVTEESAGPVLSQADDINKPDTTGKS